MAARWGRRVAGGAAALALAIVAAHVGLVAATTQEPPELGGLSAPGVVRRAGVDRAGPSWRTRRGRIHEIGLVGSPAQMGAAHAVLAKDLMIRNERFLVRELRRYLPGWLTRTLVMDAVRIRNRNLEGGFRPERLEEIAAAASVLRPDPLEGLLPTYQRGLYLHALYDTALAFEGSPMIGCSAFVASGRATVDGHTWVGRNFDAEIGEPFDKDKVVFAMRPRGKVAFVSVAWGGMGGVVTGLSDAGIWASVNGARAGEPREDGVPVTEILREVLETATTLDDAIAIASRREPMVSHLLLLADGKTGESVVLERSPGRTAELRGEATLVVTNHYRTGLSDDPKDARVRETTSTLDRFARMVEIVVDAAERDAATERGAIDAARSVGILRDRREAGGGALRVGDRRAIDALIATHSVVADVTAGVLWVSEGPHALGRYVRFDLAELLHGEAPARAPEAVAMPADPLLRESARVARRR